MNAAAIAPHHPIAQYERDAIETLRTELLDARALAKTLLAEVRAMRAELADQRHPRTRPTPCLT